MPPRYPWGTNSFPNDLFVGQYMAYEVQSDLLREYACQLSYEPKGRTLSVPIAYLSHCTHNEQARQIEDNDKYRCFKAYRKDPRENTHVYNIEERTTRQLYDHHSVLPGYLSWWGISTVEWYNSYDESGKNTREIVSRMAQGDSTTHETIYVPPYLQYCNGKACSVYGGNSFSCSFNNLIESYRKSRITCNENRIHLKKAGTLRYMHEICYVILVCMEKDLRNEDISSMPAANEPDINMGIGVKYFNSDYAHDGGWLNDMNVRSEFISEYPIRAIYGSCCFRKFYSWDTLNFAFYFPEQQGQLKVKSKYINRAATKHDKKSCRLGEMNCPDWENAWYL